MNKTRSTTGIHKKRGPGYYIKKRRKNNQIKRLGENYEVNINFTRKYKKM